MKILYCERPLNLSSPLIDTPVTLLTDSSMSRNHRPLFIPSHHDTWSISIAPAFRISRLGKYVLPKFAHRYYDAVTLAARLRPADIPRPSQPASAIDSSFDSSIVIGDWIDLPGRSSDHLPHPENDKIAKLSSLPFIIKGSVNTETIIDMVCVDETTAWLSSYFMLRHGDIIIPGDMPSSLPVAIDTALSLSLNGCPCIDIRLK